MIKRVVLRPKVPGKGLDLELYGELGNILAACEGAKMQNAPGSKASGRLSVVAGRRYHLYRTFLSSETKAQMHLQPSCFMDPENPGQPCATKPKRLKGA